MLEEAAPNVTFAVIRGEMVSVRGRKKPIELLFNLDHPDQLALVTEVNEDGDDDDEHDDLIDDEADSSEDELQKRFDRMTFVVATRKLEQLPQWVKVTEVFKSAVRAIPPRFGVTVFEDPVFEKYSRAARLRAFANRPIVWTCQRRLSYDEVTGESGASSFSIPTLGLNHRIQVWITSSMTRQERSGPT